MSSVQDQESKVELVAAPVELAAATVSPKVGAQLCAERKRLGLTVADIAQRLKYAPRQVEALESDRLEALPGLTFTRGFIRGYAKLLGLNSDPLVAMLEKSIERDAGPTTLQLQSVSAARAQFPERGRARTWPWVLAIALAIVVLGGYSIYNWHHGRDSLVARRGARREAGHFREREGTPPEVHEGRRSPRRRPRRVGVPA